MPHRDLSYDTQTFNKLKKNPFWGLKTNSCQTYMYVLYTCTMYVGHYKTRLAHESVTGSAQVTRNKLLHPGLLNSVSSTPQQIMEQLTHEAY